MLYVLLVTFFVWLTVPVVGPYFATCGMMGFVFIKKVRSYVTFISLKYLLTMDADLLKHPNGIANKIQAGK
jgi:hypothetical protein